MRRMQRGQGGDADCLVAGCRGQAATINFITLNFKRAVVKWMVSTGGYLISILVY